MVIEWGFQTCTITTSRPNDLKMRKKYYIKYNIYCNCLKGKTIRTIRVETTLAQPKAMLINTVVLYYQILIYYTFSLICFYNAFASFFFFFGGNQRLLIMYCSNWKCKLHNMTSASSHLRSPQRVIDTPHYYTYVAPVVDVVVVAVHSHETKNGCNYFTTRTYSILHIFFNLRLQFKMNHGVK